MANVTEPDDDLLNPIQSGASAELIADSVGDYVRILARRVRSGESGALPVIVGLIVIVAFFWWKSPAFLQSRNLVNLMTQSSFIITLGMAEIFVLLLGDIDLAAGFTAACGAVIALWMLALGDPLWAAVLASLAAAAARCGDHHARQAAVTVVTLVSQSCPACCFTWSTGPAASARAA
jgi:ABC-type xylose transport system permease subunit